MRQEEDQDETVESRDVTGVTVLSDVRIRNLWRFKGIGALKYSSGSVQLQSIQLLSAILNYYLLGSANTTKGVTHFWYSQNVRKENLAFSKHGGQTLRNRRQSVTTNHNGAQTCSDLSRFLGKGVKSWLRLAPHD